MLQIVNKLPPWFLSQTKSFFGDVFHSKPELYIEKVFFFFFWNLNYFSSTNAGKSTRNDKEDLFFQVSFVNIHERCLVKWHGYCHHCENFHTCFLPLGWVATQSGCIPCAIIYLYQDGLFLQKYLPIPTCFMPDYYHGPASWLIISWCWPSIQNSLILSSWVAEGKLWREKVW